MKKLFFGILAMAAMAACSTEEAIVTPKGEAIAFGNAFVDNSVRAEAATDPSYSTIADKGVALTKFNVYGAVNGVNIFNGNEVSKGDADYGVAWSLDGAAQYWIAGASYKFVAVVDGKKTVTVGEETTTITETIVDTTTGLPTTIKYTVDGKTDLLCKVATVTNAAADQGMVAFGFSHLLSKVNFSVENTTNQAATNYRIVLTEAKITNTYADGVYSVDADKWTPGTTAPYVLENLTIESAKTQYHSHEILLIPGTATSTVAENDEDVKVGLTIKANIQATSDSGANWTTVSTLSKEFDNVVALDKGKAYNFIVELGIGNEIKFTATQMTDWVDGGTITK